MMPIKSIKVGDKFMHRSHYNIYVVQDANLSEKMVLVQSYSSITGKPVGDPFWIKNTNSLFKVSNKI